MHEAGRRALRTGTHLLQHAIGLLLYPMDLALRGANKTQIVRKVTGFYFIL